MAEGFIQQHGDIVCVYVYVYLFMFLVIYSCLYVQYIQCGEQRDVSFDGKNYDNFGVFRINHGDLMIDTTVAAFPLKLWIH